MTFLDLADISMGISDFNDYRKNCFFKSCFKWTGLTDGESNFFKVVEKYVTSGCVGAEPKPPDPDLSVAPADPLEAAPLPLPAPILGGGRTQGAQQKRASEPGRVRHEADEQAEAGTLVDSVLDAAAAAVAGPNYDDLVPGAELPGAYDAHVESFRIFGDDSGDESEETDVDDSE